MGIGYSILACALWPMASYVVHNHQIGTAYGMYVCGLFIYFILPCALILHFCGKWFNLLLCFAIMY